MRIMGSTNGNRAFSKSETLASLLVVACSCLALACSDGDDEDGAAGGKGGASGGGTGGSTGGTSGNGGTSGSGTVPAFGEPETLVDNLDYPIRLAADADSLYVSVFGATDAMAGSI